MEIAKYNDMMAHLTRKRLAEGNDKPQVIPLKKPAEDPLELFKKKSDTLLQASFASTNKDYFNSLIQAEYEKAREAGVSAEDALDFLKERSQMYRTLVEEGRMQGEPATLGPSYGREDFGAGGAAEIRQYLKGLKTNSTVDISKYLKKHNLTGNKRAAASATFKRILEEFNNKNFKIITAEDAYDKFVPLNKDEAKIAKEVYKDEIKNYDSFDDWQRDTKNKYKVSDIRTGQTTLETKPTGIIKDDPDRIRTVAKRGQENISDVIFPDKIMPSGKTMEQEFLDDLDIKFSTPRGQGLQNADFVKKYPISNKQVQRVINFYIKKKGLKYPKGETTGSYKQKKEKYGPVTDLTTEETISKKLKQPILREKNLVKKTGKVTKGVIDFAHRISKEHANALGIQFGTENTGFDSRLINQIIVRPSEIRLEKFYERQRNILDKIKSKGATKELIDEMNTVNGLINKEVKKTSGRLIGVNIDPNTQEISFTGQNKKFKFSNLNQTFQEIKNIPYEERIELLRKDVAKGVDAEIKRGFRPYDFRLILGDPKNRKTLLKYAKENAPDIFSKFKKILDNPESKKRFALYSKLPTVALPAGIVLSLAGQSGDAMAAETGQLPQGSPGQLNPEDKKFYEDYPLTTGTAVAATPLVTKTGRKIYGSLAKNLLRAFGSVPAATYFAGKELTSEDPSYAIAGADLLLPELGKRLPTSGTGIMSKIGRFALNPIGRLARGFTPAGIVLQGAELVNQAIKEQRRIDDMRENDPEAYQQYLAEQKDLLRESAAYGGRMGFADGPEDPSKRKFMKIFGGLASLPILGRFFDVAKEAAPVIDAVKTEAVKGKPEWFDALVNKVIRMGEDVTDRFATVDREIVNQIDIADGETVRVYRNVDEGSVRVEYESPDNMGEGSVDLVYKKPNPDEGDPSPSANFYATELEPRGIRTGPDDYDIEFDGENYADSIDELMSDTTKLKEFATGEKRTMKEIVESKKKKDKTKAMNESTMEQAEYLESKYGPGDDLYYQDYSDYD